VTLKLVHTPKTCIRACAAEMMSRPVQLEDRWERARVDGLPPDVREEVEKNEHQRCKNMVSLVRAFESSVPDRATAAAHPELFADAASWMFHIDMCVPLLLYYLTLSPCSLFNPEQVLLLQSTPQGRNVPARAACSGY
jgi:hypothetical protein